MMKPKTKSFVIGGHTTGPNWPTFLRFAERYTQGPAVLATPK
jgi:hypothetical protein